MSKNNTKIAIIGMGYVGLPLAVEFGKIYETIGYDFNRKKINSLKKNYDLNGEVTSKDLKKSKKLSFTNNIKHIAKFNFYIITVPTPLKKNKKPNLDSLINACKKISKLLKKKDIIIIESTVYPGVTEEICAPIIEKYSKLKFNKDFFMGYSPERINPGDKKHNITNICKITSGSTIKISKIIDELYSKIITSAKTYLVKSIKVAEAAKVIENAQRDINIAFVNELAIIFNKLNINSSEVFKAAETKWNYLPFRPGLVGGHCIGVDPYYLSHKSSKSGYIPKIILSGRNLNENMSNYITKQIIYMSKKIKFNKIKDKILILGLTFKENCEDVRNSKVVDIFKKLKKNKFIVEIVDPKANREDTKKYYNLQIKDFNKVKLTQYKIIILAVPHKEFKKINLQNLIKGGSFIYDIKNFFDKKYVYMSL